MSDRGADAGMTLAGLKAAMDALGPPVPDPLNGATDLYAAENMLVAASDIRRARGVNPPFDPELTVHLDPHVPPGRIVGMRGTKIVLLIGPPVEKPHA